MEWLHSYIFVWSTVASSIWYGHLIEYWEVRGAKVWNVWLALVDNQDSWRELNVMCRCYIVALHSRPYRRFILQYWCKYREPSEKLSWSVAMFFSTKGFFWQSLRCLFVSRQIIDRPLPRCVYAARLFIPVYGPLHICFHWNGDGET
jgi:hypothetical protein